MDIFCVKLDSSSVYVRIKENNIYRRCLSARRLTVKTSDRKEVKVFVFFPDTCRRLFASPKAIKIVGVDIFYYFLLIIQYERMNEWNYCYIYLRTVVFIPNVGIQSVKESRTIEKE